jgi:competence ComEA-like helix-hairpin-helix protein
MPPERRAVLLLLGLAAAGQGVRACMALPGEAPGQVSLLQAGLPLSSAQAHRDSSLALSRPLGKGERIDLDHAPAAEIARLPRVGMRLAKAIVADRSQRGPFGRLEALDRVPGVGPGLLTAIAPHARFDPLPDRVADEALKIPAMAAAPMSPAAAPLELNRATREELERLPFIGPYMADQIVAWRERHGPFASVDSLVRVPGVGPATLRRVRHRLRVD